MQNIHHLGSRENEFRFLEYFKNTLRKFSWFWSKISANSSILLATSRSQATWWKIHWLNKIRHILLSRHFYSPNSKNWLHERTYQKFIIIEVSLELKNQIHRELGQKNNIKRLSIFEQWLRYHNSERFIRCLGKTKTLVISQRESSQDFHRSPDVARFSQDLSMLDKMLVRGSNRLIIERFLLNILHWM